MKRDKAPEEASRRPAIVLSTPKQIFLTVVANLTTLSPGMSTGWSGVSLPFLTDYGYEPRLTYGQSSWVASIFSIATPIGCLISGPVLDKYGRKRALYTVNVLMILGWTFVALSKHVGFPYGLLLIGRFITGIGCGVASTPTTVYASEISTPKLRGMLATWTTVSFTIGVLLVYIFGYYLRDSWHVSAWIACGVAVVAIVATYVLLPESPVWLQKPDVARRTRKRIAKKNKKDEKDEQEDEYTTVATEEDETEPSSSCRTVEGFVATLCERIETMVDVLKRPECFKPLLIMSGYFMFQQFSGTFVVIFYAVDIIREAGITRVDPFLVAIVVGVTRTASAVLIGYISKKHGRRLPSIASGAAMTLCMVVIAEYLYVSECDTADFRESFFNEREIPMYIPRENVRYEWVPIATLIVYYFMSTLGFLSIPFAMIGEVYPESVRGLFSGVTSCIGYTFCFIIIKLYPTMSTGMHRSGPFLFYGIVSFLGTMFVIVFLPETKGKSLHEIETMFKRHEEDVGTKIGSEDRDRNDNAEEDVPV